MNPVNVGCDKGSTLAVVNQIVSEREAVLGPLTGIGNNGTATTLTFDTDLNPPAKNAVIAPDNAGNPNIPAGSIQVCRGTIFIAGALTASTASRPT
jgi:hypothetical protein